MVTIVTVRGCLFCVEILKIREFALLGKDNYYRYIAKFLKKSRHWVVHCNG